MKFVFMSKPGPCAGIAPIAIVAVLLLLLASAPLDVHSKPRPAPSPLPWVPIHAIFGTPYLYAPHEFTVDPNVVPKNSAKYQATNGYRAESFLENLNQKTVENNTKLYDVEDSTRSYRSPLSFW